jgi:hypothetical protein
MTINIEFPGSFPFESFFSALGGVFVDLKRGMGEEMHEVKGWKSCGGV